MSSSTPSFYLYPFSLSNKKMNNKIFWSKVKSSLFPSKKGKSIKDGEDKNSLSKKPNVNEEYKEVFRTQSYAEIWSKVQVELRRSSLDNNRTSYSLSSPLSSPISSMSSNCLLEPGQEAVIDMVRSSDLKPLLVDYFEASLEAYNVCELLLGGIQKTRSNQRVMKRIINYGDEQGKMMSSSSRRDKVVQELAWFARQSNPLKGKVDFKSIHEKYSLVLQKLTRRRRKIKRREKLSGFLKKMGGYSLVVTYVVVAVAVLVIAMHTVVGLLGVPGLLVAPSSSFLIYNKKGKKGRLGHEKLASQLDMAAKGVYIFINDFDTVGRLVIRVGDQVEDMRALAEMCVRNSNNQELVKEALRELTLHHHALSDQLQELEDHIYLCFLTINRSRRLVIQQIMSPALN